MGRHPDHDLFRLVIFLDNVAAYDGVRSFHVVVRNFPDVVEKPGRLGQLYVETQLPGDHGRKMSHLKAVFHQILAVRIAVFHPPQQPN